MRLIPYLYIHVHVHVRAFTASTLCNVGHSHLCSAAVVEDEWLPCSRREVVRHSLHCMLYLLQLASYIHVPVYIPTCTCASIYTHPITYCNVLVPSLQFKVGFAFLQ